MSSDVIIGHGGKPRCAWAGTGNAAAVRYHDEVWGTRTYNEPAMFEAPAAGSDLACPARHQACRYPTASWTPTSAVRAARAWFPQFADGCIAARTGDTL